jgi:RimJ/RimL family protein N-acetyltransferase
MDNFRIYNDKETMLPYLPMLCPMSREDLLARRVRYRQEALRGKSCFLDILERGTGEVVGFTGFRSVDGDLAEWGIVISKQYQRQGVCRDAFETNLHFAKDVLCVKHILVCTSSDNLPMMSFLEKRGLPRTGRNVHHGLEWVEYSKPIDELLT